MISVEDRYFSLNRTFLLMVGLWHFQNSKLARLQFICLFSILISCILVQFTTFITSQCTINLVMDVLSNSGGFICFAIKYHAFSSNSNTVKYLIGQLQRIYNDLKDSNEIAIIERYGRNGKFYTISFAILLVCSIFVTTSAQILPDFLQIISSVNKSRTNHLLITVEYFVDQEKYFYYLLLHINIAIFIGFAAVAATSTTFLAYFQQMCAMFTIASYRIENAIKIQKSQDIIPEKKNLIHQNIRSAVDIHRKAMEFCTYLISKFEISFLLLIIFGVMTLSLNIFRIITSTCNIENLLIAFTIGCLSFMYMFLANFVGQEITDHYNYIYIAAYKIRWYLAPLDIQRMIMILIQRGNKTFGLNIGRLFIASIQCFAALANASLSYFTVMYSVR